jgi:hypothetical protein
MQADRIPVHLANVLCGRENLTLKISMNDFMRRENGLSKWFETCRHALASDFFFARVHKTRWLDPAMAAGVVERILGKETCISVSAAPPVVGVGV